MFSGDLDYASEVQRFSLASLKTAPCELVPTGLIYHFRILHPNRLDRVPHMGICSLIQMPKQARHSHLPLDVAQSSLKWL